ETQAAVLDALDGLPVAITTGTSSTSVVATMEGSADGPAILLRGDMDALPLVEDTGLDFASEIEGRMHACGHDAHTAMLAGALRLLAERRSEWSGRVIAMFQPGEEGAHGAKHMIDEGLLAGPDGKQDPSITKAFAVHVTPLAPSGWVVGRPGTQLASADEFFVTVQGAGGHGSMPHQSRDPIPVACEIVLALQSAVTRRIDVFDPAVVSVGQVNAGTATNVIPPNARIAGTIRATSQATRTRAQDLVTSVAEGVAAAHGLRSEVEHRDGYSVTANNPAVVEVVSAIARQLLGNEAVFIPMPNPVMGAEDFGEVLDRVPGAMVFLGACPPDVAWTEAAPNHSNLMRIDEAAMATGMALHASVALAHLGA
ncbi:MAG: M20 family metallopeptidase, partial [Acidimicrobiales bacterium]